MPQTPPKALILSQQVAQGKNDERSTLVPGLGVSAADRVESNAMRLVQYAKGVLLPSENVFIPTVLEGVTLHRGLMHLEAQIEVKEGVAGKIVRVKTIGTEKAGPEVRRCCAIPQFPMAISGMVMGPTRTMRQLSIWLLCQVDSLEVRWVEG